MTKWLSRNTIVGTVITLTWIVTMSVLLRDYVIRYRPDVLPASQVTAAALAGGFKNVNEYHLVISDGKPIGAARFSVERLQGDDRNTTGFLAGFQLRLKINALGMNHKIAVSGGGVLDSEFVIDRFALDADLGPAKFSALGKLVGTTVLLSTNRLGVKQLSRIRMANDVSLLQAIQPTITTRMEITPGNSVRIPVFDPLLSMDHGSMDVIVRDKEKITVAGKTVEAWKISSRLNDNETEMWVDSQGEVLKRSLMLENTSLDRCAKEEALKIATDLDDAIEIGELELKNFRDVKVQTIEELAQSSGVAGMIRQISGR